MKHIPEADRTNLALQELQASTPTSANMTQVILISELGNDSSSVTTPNDDCGPFLYCFGGVRKKRLRALRECRELKYTRGAEKSHQQD